MSFGSSKPPKVEQTPMPVQPTMARSITENREQRDGGFTSMISTSSQGLTKKASTRKNTLLGGSSGANAGR